jgi:prepilin-type N-terminal cleavage/methylation domain-containing protein
MERVKRAPIEAGFTLIEIILTIVIASIFITAVALMFQQNIISLKHSDDIEKASSLAQLEMSKVDNLSYADATLADGYNNTTTNYESTAYDLNRQVNIVAGTSNNLKKVELTVYPTGTTQQLAKLVTYKADVSFGPGSGGGSVGGGQADSLTVTGGSISGTNLQNITLANTSGDPITITGATVTFSGASGIKISTITMDGSTRWSGNQNSGSTITLDTSFTLAASTTYTNTCTFGYSKNLTSATVVFIMSDGTSTPTYSWP